MKTIAVQEGLEEIKRALVNRGYNVVDFQETGYIDGIVYIDKGQGFENLNSIGDVNPHGAIMVNARGKSIDEIGDIIESRKYGNLFT